MDNIEVLISGRLDPGVKAKISAELAELNRKAQEAKTSGTSLTKEQLNLQKQINQVQLSNIKVESSQIKLQQQKITLESKELKLRQQISAEQVKATKQSATQISATEKTLAQSYKSGNLANMVNQNLGINSVPKSAKESAAAFGLVEEQVKKVSVATKQATADQYSFSNMLSTAAKKIVLWGISTQLVYGTLNKIKEGIQSIADLDKSITELNKVTDVSGMLMGNFVNEAYNAGVVLGRTGKEVIDATTVFARAGYNLKDSLELSKQALLLSNIGDGMGNVEEVASELIAVLKGYNLTVNDTAHVTDLLNEVSNKYAVDTNNLTDGLQRTSGTLSQTGTSMEQLTGILTGSYEVLRDMEKSSSGLITISQRLRGIGEDGEAVDGLMPKLEKDFERIAHIKISDGEGGLRSTYDILKDLSVIWPTLNDQQRQYLGELAAGNKMALCA